MKVFVAGATGVVGRRTVARLVAAGAEVTGAARSLRAAAVLSGLGARPPGQPVRPWCAGGRRRRARRGLQPRHLDPHRRRRRPARVVGGQPPHPPGRVPPPGGRGAGGRCYRYVQESIALLYADGGDALLDESAPVEPTWITGSSLHAEAQAARFTVGGGAGIALRFGYFYGPDSGHTVDAVAAARAGVAAGRAGRPPPSARSRRRRGGGCRGRAGRRVASTTSPTTSTLPGSSTRRWPGPEGIVPPASRRPSPRCPPSSPLSRSHRVVNHRFVTATGWRPRHPSVWEGAGGWSPGRDEALPPRHGGSVATS